MLRTSLLAQEETEAKLHIYSLKNKGHGKDFRQDNKPHVILRTEVGFGTAGLTCTIHHLGQGI